MSLKLLTILTGQGDISKVSVFSKTSKCTCNIFLEIIPLQAKFVKQLAGTDKKVI